jgi:type II secretion system protein H
MILRMTNECTTRQPGTARRSARAADVVWRQLARDGARGATRPAGIRHSSLRRGFTLIELILVLALLVIITSITVPTMARFIRGRALDTEARRLVAVTHAAQSRAVSEGMPVMLWVNEQAGTYGFASESSAQTGAQAGDPKAETLTADSTLAISVLNTTVGVPTTFNNLPAIRFQADGTVDENSPQTLRLTDSDGFSRWLVESRYHTGYEITDTAPQ